MWQFCDCFIQYTHFKDDLIDKNYQHKFDEKLKEQLFHTYTFCSQDNKKFILLLWKGVYPYEYIDDWEKFSKTLLPKKEDFYNHLNMEDITDADYAHIKWVCKDSKIKNLGVYHDLYVQSDGLLLAEQ